jgi:hypothetical protein
VARSKVNVAAYEYDAMTFRRVPTEGSTNGREYLFNVSAKCAKALLDALTELFEIRESCDRAEGKRK